jgi:hypothetical protein
LAEELRAVYPKRSRNVGRTTRTFKITEEEYLGRLVDFTGESGRWAVLKI